MAGGRDSDLVVVGGGPAGCAAAIWATRRGLRTELIHRPERDGYRPGETLPPAIEPLLRQLGAAHALLAPGFARTAGHTVSWGEHRSFETYGMDAAGPWLGFHVCRRTLERGLRDAARDAGVLVSETAARIRPLLRADRRIAGVRLGDTGTTIRAAAVVDAAGSRHWLARSIGLEVRRCSPQLVARYGAARCHGGTEPELVADADGWTWIAPVDDETLAWVRLSLRPGELPERLAELDSCTRTHGADVTWRIVTRTAGPGYVLAGDAAFVLDPVSSHGVLHAVMSGMMAAEMLAKHLVDGVPEAVTSAVYRRWATTRFGADIAALRSLYAALPCPPAWAVRR